MSYRQTLAESVARDVRRFMVRAREDVPVWLETPHESDLERLFILYYGYIQKMNSYELTQIVEHSVES